ncbi:MAG TPA: four helix bundle protein [Kofleriaceae bacterium]|nr:four helix bundle protein [Kofleriaceae bacterium]
MSTKPPCTPRPCKPPFSSSEPPFSSSKPPFTPRFHAFEIALEIARSLRGLVAAVRKHDGSLADQLRRAASSVALNIAEGNRRRGRDRLHHFRIAAGSADEVAAALRIAEAWGYLSSREIAATLALVDRQLAVLYRLSEG